MREKKSKCPQKKNFSKCEEGKKKNVSVEFRVFGKKMKEKFREEKNQSNLGGGNFAKFVFTGWTLC